MRQMVHDVHDKCLQFNGNVLCEVYDGQFLNLVCFSEDGTPLTRLAFLLWFFKKIQSWSKAQCVNYLVTDAIPNGVPLEVLVTPDKVNLWKKHVEQVNRRRGNRHARGDSVATLDQDDVTKLLKGSQLGSRLSRQIRDQNVTMKTPMTLLMMMEATTPMLIQTTLQMTLMWMTSSLTVMNHQT